MGAKSFLLIAVFAMSTLLYLVYLGATYEPPEGTTTIVIPPPESQRVQAEPETSQPIQRQPAGPQPAAPAVETPAAGEPEQQAAAPGPPDEVVAEPVTEAEVEPAPVELPSLNASDAFIAEQVQQLADGAALLRQVTDEQLIRRTVVLVDNLSRNQLPQNNLPYRNVPGEFPVRNLDDNLFQLDPAGYRRFDQAVNALVAIDTEQAMNLYRLARPLFQQAYAELGYGDENFDNALRRAIRNVLDTDDVGGNLQLVKPSVMYLYADSEIESMSDIQKQMIRIGPENREKLKAKLRQILQAL